MILVTPPAAPIGHGEFGHGISAQLSYPVSASAISTDITLHSIPALIDYPYLPDSPPPPTREISLWAGTTRRGRIGATVEYEGVLVTSVGNNTTYKIWWAYLAGTHPDSTMTQYATPNTVKAGDTLEFINTAKPVKSNFSYKFTLTVKDDTHHWSASVTTPETFIGPPTTTAALGMTPVQLPTNDAKFEFTQNVNFSALPTPKSVNPVGWPRPYEMTYNMTTLNSFSIVPYSSQPIKRK